MTSLQRFFRTVPKQAAAALLLSPSLAIANDCPIQIGKTISYDSPATTYAHFEEFDVMPREFETTEEHRERLSAVLKDGTKPFIVRGKYDVDAAKYDADRQTLRLFVYAWANAGTGWDEVFPVQSHRGTIEYSRFGSQSYLGIGLGSEESVVGEYKGSNAYGASTTVYEVERQVYSVFDQEVRNEDLWQFEGKGIYDTQHGPMKDTGYVDIPMPVDQARQYKDELKVVVAFLPKGPFAASGSRRWTPKINRPRDVTANYRVTFGMIQCVGILSPDDRALKVIEPNK